MGYGKRAKIPYCRSERIELVSTYEMNLEIKHKIPSTYLPNGLCGELVGATGFEPPLTPITPVQDRLWRGGRIDRICEITSVGSTDAAKGTRKSRWFGVFNRGRCVSRHCRCNFGPWRGPPKDEASERDPTLSARTRDGQALAAVAGAAGAG